MRSRERLILEDEELPIEFASKSRGPYISPALPPSQRPAASSDTGDPPSCGTGLSAVAPVAAALPVSARKLDAPAPVSDNLLGTAKNSSAVTPKNSNAAAPKNSSAAAASSSDEVPHPPSTPSAVPLSTSAGAAAAAASFPTTPPDSSGAGVNPSTEGSRNVGRSGGGKSEESLPGGNYGENEPDDLMAQVAWLEEQGRLVEASNLMARALRRGAAGGA